MEVAQHQLFNADLRLPLRAPLAPLQLPRRQQLQPGKKRDAGQKVQAAGGSRMSVGSSEKSRTGAGRPSLPVRDAFEHQPVLPARARRSEQKQAPCNAYAGGAGEREGAPPTLEV